MRWRARNPAKHRLGQMKWHFKTRYGLTVDDVERMFERANGSCQICGLTLVRGRGKYAVDHDHDTGRIRGLLCAKCNTAIGLMRNNPDLLMRAVHYLRDADFAEYA